MIRTVLIEDIEIIRLGIITAITRTSNSNISVCGESATGAKGLELVKSLRPNVAIVDINLPDMSGIELTENIKKFDNSIKVLILSGETKKEIVKAAFISGADSYCTKQLETKKLIDAVITTHRGESYIDSAISRTLIGMLNQADEKPVEKKKIVEKDSLTKKETDVLRLMAAGLTNDEIANKLYISLGTLRSHSHKIYGKLKVKNRMQAVVIGIERNLIDYEDVMTSKGNYSFDSKQDICATQRLEAVRSSVYIPA
ncbi:hypothetical protein WA1_50175 [Scytonema hofmannii PCC 7110]|uniref:LuxR family transcriptional regulator n=1 Tax=Scytonema hofmannii PCC 7110 TaxID=128403 RepID=A0A139WR20_9CYAN|nr:response regulator transcription factor [Scytonema hofmannii]KYC34895.1 hypothetical protein WA1_50175 [Scytonema hofmannii PCC 7110]